MWRGATILCTFLAVWNEERKCRTASIILCFGSAAEPRLKDRERKGGGEGRVQQLKSQLWSVGTHATTLSGWAKKSEYISSRDFFSKMKVGRVTCTGGLQQ